MYDVLFIHVAQGTKDDSNDKEGKYLTEDTNQGAPKSHRRTKSHTKHLIEPTKPTKVKLIRRLARTLQYSLAISQPETKQQP